jgi:hypothetical protein
MIASADFILLAKRHEQSLWFFVHELVTAGDLMRPIIDYCRMGLNFIRDGLPTDSPSTSQKRHSTNSTRKNGVKPAPPPPLPSFNRLKVDYDVLLKLIDEPTQVEILEEIRGLALWTMYKKCYADLALRVDLLLVEGSSLKITSGQLTSLYSDLLSQDSVVLEYIECRGGTGGGGENDWAWFAEEDILDDPSAIKLDWRAAKAVEKALLESSKRKKAKQLRKKDKLNGIGVPALDEGEGVIIRKFIPGPRMGMTKILLGDYLDATERSLEFAREALA